MLTPNNAKDLLALSCVAFRNNDIESAGSLFAQAMTLHDSEEFIDSLLEGNFTCAALAATLDDASNSEDPDQLASIASTLSFSMSNSFRQGLKDSLMEDEDFEELSESGCNKHTSHADADDLDEDEYDEDEDFDSDLSDEDELESESNSQPLFGNVKSAVMLG